MCDLFEVRISWNDIEWVDGLISIRPTVDATPTYNRYIVSYDGSEQIDMLVLEGNFIGHELVQSVYIGYYECPISFTESGRVICTIPPELIGSFPILATHEYGKISGMDDVEISLDLELRGVSPSTPVSGLLGGRTVYLRGTSFLIPQIG